MWLDWSEPELEVREGNGERASWYSVYRSWGGLLRLLWAGWGIIWKVMSREVIRAAWFENGSLWIPGWKDNAHSIGKEGPSHMHFFLL